MRIARGLAPPDEQGDEAGSHRGADEGATKLHRAPAREKKATEKLDSKLMRDKYRRAVFEKRLPADHKSLNHHHPAYNEWSISLAAWQSLR